MRDRKKIRKPWPEDSKPKTEDVSVHIDTRAIAEAVETHVRDQPLLSARTEILLLVIAGVICFLVFVIAIIVARQNYHLAQIERLLRK